VQIDDDEKERRAGGVHIANEPAPFDIAHDVFDGRKRINSSRLVVHRQENAGKQLNRQHDKREHAEYVPPVKILGCVILGGVILHRFRERKTIINPLHQPALGLANFCFDSRHYAAPVS